MPTPVTVARQCLTPEAATALDEAVGVARRRCHAQTTSIHAISALLSPPSSPLRAACARNSAYASRVQFRALELSLSVSLDRVPSGQKSGSDPPVSNSLMAAIKRSQANQRRQPENLHLYRDISQQNGSNISCVKVELQHLILSILDDPVVSRVFGEAGFRSSEIKLAIIRPLPSLLRFSRHRAPPVFLCNLENPPIPEPHRFPNRRNFNFPFSGFPSSDGEENSRRIGEVISQRRNPLVLGICAPDALITFVDSIRNRKDGILAKGLSGLNLICISDDLSRCINGEFDKVHLESKFDEISRVLQRDLGSGLVINYGDLKVFLNDSGNQDDPASYVVSQLTRFLQLHGEKVWLLGFAATYETYSNFTSRFSSIEKDWNLQILPITSHRPSMAESFPKSSLMDSFVPFAGFFPVPSEVKGSISNPYLDSTRCYSCDAKCEQEILAVSKGVPFSMVDQYQSSLAPWLQMTELSTSNGLDVKAKGDETMLSVRKSGLQKKWDCICQQLHHTHPFPVSRNLQSNSEFPTVVGFQFIRDDKETTVSPGGNKGNGFSDETNCRNVNSSASQSDMPSSVVSKTKNNSFLSKLREKPSKGENLETVGSISRCSLSNSSVVDGRQESPTSVTSLTTDLGLGLCSVPSSNSSVKTTMNPGCFRADVDFINGGISNQPAQSSSSSFHSGWLDSNDFKMLFRELSDRVGWQDEATHAISQTVCQARIRNQQRGDLWFNFIGPDRYGKKKIAIALAEVIYGSRENFIYIDLSSEDGMNQTCDVRFRGKTVVDYVAGELMKTPLSVVFLENVDKSDVLVQGSLSNAIRTGKFSDSQGREVSTKNAIFVTTRMETKADLHRMESSNYSEEKILRTKGWPIRILVDSGKGGPNLSLGNKRKLSRLSGTEEEAPKRAKLDLNIPAEDEEAQETVENDFPESWLHIFEENTVKVIFKPFDFDTLADKLLNQVTGSFQNISGSECSLRIDPRVVEQLLAAAYLSESKRVVEEWVESVLSKGFAEVLRRNKISAHSVLRLVSCEGLSFEDQEQGAFLPKIILT